MSWLRTNAYWIFEGIGVAIIAWVGWLFFHRKAEAKHSQIQNSGKGSTNLQAGRDLNIGQHKNDPKRPKE